ncbi:hypothetical protein KSP40_PGU006547 [Platanthera guangdongensis]|uniref:Translation initiation factor IF2/IF5 domain-containing protein n=1 Tax=Platanthera guangdongensis TaxID=2320717 RepID=A0ABR2LTA8_9ASPA
MAFMDRLRGRKITVDNNLWLAPYRRGLLEGRDGVSDSKRKIGAATGWNGVRCRRFAVVGHTEPPKSSQQRATAEVTEEAGPGREMIRRFSTLMHRQPEHVMMFLLAEMGTSGSLDGQQRLVVKGRFAPKNFEGIVRRYVKFCLASSNLPPPLNSLLCTFPFISDQLLPVSKPSPSSPSTSYSAKWEPKLCLTYVLAKRSKSFGPQIFSNQENIVVVEPDRFSLIYPVRQTIDFENECRSINYTTRPVSPTPLTNHGGHGGPPAISRQPRVHHITVRLCALLIMSCPRATRRPAHRHRRPHLHPDPVTPPTLQSSLDTSQLSLASYDPNHPRSPSSSWCIALSLLPAASGFFFIQSPPASTTTAAMNMSYAMDAKVQTPYCLKRTVCYFWVVSSLRLVIASRPTKVVRIEILDEIISR